MKQPLSDTEAKNMSKCLDFSVELTNFAAYLLAGIGCGKAMSC